MEMHRVLKDGLGLAAKKFIDYAKLFQFDQAIWGIRQE